VLFIVGQVEAKNANQMRQLAKGDSVRVGDILKAGKGATLQLRMEDGGMIVLRPESQLAIESFEYKNGQSSSGHIALALLSGGFRAVTGEIGHLHKENYSIRTPNAKVGILGTDHETIFIPATQSGQGGVVEAGTYNRVISGATVLQTKQGNLQIKPNQTGFAALNGTSPIMFNRPLPLFSGLTVVGEEALHSDEIHSTSEGKKNAGSNDQLSHPEHNSPEHSSKGSAVEDFAPNADQNASEAMPVSGQISNNSTSGLEQNKITQSDKLANTTLDLNTLETDATRASEASVVTGANMAAGRLTVGSAQAGNPGEILFTEKDIPSSYSNNVTGFNFIENDGKLIDSGSAQVDDVEVNWGVYAGGVSYNVSGNPVAVNYHPFAFAHEGATPLTVVQNIGGSANFPTMVGNTQPVTETGNVGGSVNLNVGINLGAATVTNYTLAVTDASSRNWNGTFNGSVALSTFAQNGVSLAVTCAGCISTLGSGSAVGVLIGTQAKGLISSYVLSTPSGQSVVGAAIVSRP
jgi:hypothetical protein